MDQTKSFNQEKKKKKQIKLQWKKSLAALCPCEDVSRALFCVCLYTVLHPLDRLPHKIQNGFCSGKLWGLRQWQKPVNKPDLTWNFIFHMPPSDYITFEGDPLLAQNWKWVTHSRNCNLFIHHSFFSIKAPQIRTQRISSSLLPFFVFTIVFVSHLQPSALQRWQIVSDFLITCAVTFPRS